MLRPFLIALTLAPAAAPILADTPAETGQWMLGRTGILCYAEPCPWNGVRPMRADGTAGWPLSRENLPEPPSIRASDADRARIAATWAASGCLLVDGRFNGGVLVIDHILGDCA